MEEETFLTSNVKVKINAVASAVIGRANLVSHALLLVIKESMYKYPAIASPSISMEIYIGIFSKAIGGMPITQINAHNPTIGIDQSVLLNTR